MPLDLQAIRERAEKATAGPWHAYFDGGIADTFSVREDHRKLTDLIHAIPQDECDAAFIAHAREDIPALLARVDELTAVLENMAYEHAIPGGRGNDAYLWAGASSALEEAFKVLGWPERQPVPAAWRR